MRPAVATAILVIFACAALQMTGGSPVVILDLPSLVLVGIGVGVFLACNCGPGDVGLLASPPAAGLTDAERTRATRAAAAGALASLGLGALFSLVSLVLVLGAWDGSFEVIGPHLALSLITLVYGAIAAIFFGGAWVRLGSIPRRPE